jgi:predicted phage terminase large subunit-like protein
MLPALEDRIGLQREIGLRGGLSDFVRMGWSQVESVPLIGGWHLDEICAHLEAVSKGQIKRLGIAVPPGMTKSLTVSVFWPVWDWIRRPELKWMFSTFDAELARRDSLRARQLLRSQWFNERWGEEVALDESPDKQQTMGVYHTTGGGFRFSSSVGGRATGWHAHRQVVDDPTKPKDVQQGGDAAREALERTWLWWKGTMASRKADPHDFARVIIMQRLHEDDLIGRCIAEGGWELLCLPMRFEPDRKCKTMVGGDRRTQDGELLCPARFNEEAVTLAEREMGSLVAAAQLQQRPAPAAGAVFKREWLLKEWRELPASASLIQSWDCTFKGADNSDYVVGQVWAHSGASYYLVDQVRAKMDFPATVAAIKSLSKKWPRAVAKLIEDKANGPAVISALQKEVPGMVAVNPEGGKEARANAEAPLFEAGNVYVPAPDAMVGGVPVNATWLHDWREEMAVFPRGRNDDQVDTTTQALCYMRAKSVNHYVEAVKKMAAGGTR